MLEAIRYIQSVEGFSPVILRKSYPEICNVGGMWDEATKIYPHLGAKPKLNSLEWVFPPHNNRVAFRYLANEADLLKYQGSQIPLIIFDQLEHFTKRQFFYMLSRNRSACGVTPYVRATANPDADSFLAEFLDWWIGADGYPIEERSGLVRYFVNVRDELIWADNYEELRDRFPELFPKSASFISATIYDNKKLLEVNPEYLANLMALSPVDQERLLKGNWRIRDIAGKVFNESWFEIVDAVPDLGKKVRFWDLAATERDLKTDTKKTEPCYTASIKMMRSGDIYYILDCTENHWSAGQTNQMIRNYASQDGNYCSVRWEREGGASGKRDNFELAKFLDGYDVGGIIPQGDKVQRAKPLSAAAYQGRVKLLRGDWNKKLLTRLHNFPDAAIKDVVDASSGAYNFLAKREQLTTGSKSFTTF